MKVLMINGSPNEKGCTYTALCEIKKTLQTFDIDSEIIYLGTEAVPGCKGCKACAKLKKCVYNDIVNEIGEKIKDCDGLICGSPVHYAAASGTITSFLDRLFYSHSASFAGKVGASVVSCRRGGASAAFDQLNKYFTIANMPLVTSQYWNQVHGAKAEDVLADEEGLQTMRTLAMNMAWLLKCIESGKKAGINLPQYEQKIRTNFIK